MRDRESRVAEIRIAALFDLGEREIPRSGMSMAEAPKRPDLYLNADGGQFVSGDCQRNEVGKKQPCCDCEAPEALPIQDLLFRRRMSWQEGSRSNLVLDLIARAQNPPARHSPIVWREWRALCELQRITGTRL